MSSRGNNNEPPPPPENNYFFFFSQQCNDCKKFYDQLPELPSEILDRMEGYEISTGNYPPELRRVPAIMTQIYYHDEGRHKNELLEGSDAFLWFNNEVVVGSSHDGGGKIKFSFIQDEQKLSSIDAKQSVFLDEKQYQNQQMRLTPEQITNPLMQPYNIINPKNMVINNTGMNNMPQTKTIHTGLDMPEIVPEGSSLPTINIDKTKARDLDQRLDNVLSTRNRDNYHQQQRYRPAGQMPDSLKPMETKIDNSLEFNKQLERALSDRNNLPQVHTGYQNKEALEPIHVNPSGNKEDELNRQINSKMMEREQMMKQYGPRHAFQKKPPVYRPPRQKQHRQYPHYQQQQGYRPPVQNQHYRSQGLSTSQQQNQRPNNLSRQDHLNQYLLGVNPGRQY